MFTYWLTNNWPQKTLYTSNTNNQNKATVSKQCVGIFFVAFWVFLKEFVLRKVKINVSNVLIEFIMNWIELSRSASPRIAGGIK